MALPRNDAAARVAAAQLRLVFKAELLQHGSVLKVCSGRLINRLQLLSNTRSVPTSWFLGNLVRRERKQERSSQAAGSSSHDTVLMLYRNCIVACVSIQTNGVKYPRFYPRTQRFSFQVFLCVCFSRPLTARAPHAPMPGRPPLSPVRVPLVCF